MAPYLSTDWETIVDAKKISQLHKIPFAWRIPKWEKLAATDLRPVVHRCNILTELEIEITSIISVPELADKISNRTYTALEVVTAFCKTAAIAHQL